MMTAESQQQHDRIAAQMLQHCCEQVAEHLRGPDADARTAIAQMRQTCVLAEKEMGDAAPAAEAGTPLPLAEVKRAHIQAVIDRNGGDVRRAAAVLGVSVRAVQQNLRECGANRRPGAPEGNQNAKKPHTRLHVA